MDCFEKDSCANYGVKCHEKPCYLKKPVKIKLGGGKAVKLIYGTDPALVETAMNDFIKDRDVIDILYQSVQIAKPPYVTDRVMIIYKEET